MEYTPTARDTEDSLSSTLVIFEKKKTTTTTESQFHDDRHAVTQRSLVLLSMLLSDFTTNRL